MKETNTNTFPKPVLITEKVQELNAGNELGH